MILNKKIIRDVGYELFDEEWNNYISDLNRVLKSIIDTPYLLVPFNLEDSLGNFPIILRIQKTDVEVFRSLVLMFMMINDIRVGIYRDSNLIKEKFPLKLGEEDLAMFKKYSIKGKKKPFNFF